MSLENPILLEKDFEKFLSDKKRKEYEYLKVDSILSNINNSKLRLESQIEFMDQSIVE